MNISFLYFKECRENYGNLSRSSLLMEMISIEEFFYCCSEGYRRLLSVNDNYRKTIIPVFHRVI